MGTNRRQPCQDNPSCEAPGDHRVQWTFGANYYCCEHVAQAHEAAKCPLKIARPGASQMPPKRILS